MGEFKKAIFSIYRQLAPAALKYANLNKLKDVKPDAIVIVGMGGSGQVGDLIANLAQELKIPVPVLVWKDYGLPILNYKKPLYVLISFSGNTEETLSGLKSPGLKAAVCSGGQLKNWAMKNNIPLALFSPDGLMPRQANGYMFYGAVNIIKSVFKQIKLPALTKINVQKLEKEGQKISRELKGKTILMYATSQNSYLAYNWKTRLNETAKNLSFSGTVPEMSHNEIVPFETRPKNLIAVFLKDNQDHPRNTKKIELIIKLLKNYGVKSLKIGLRGASRLEKTWNSLVLADWTSYHLAKIQKNNPRETKLIDQLKKLMD